MTELQTVSPPGLIVHESKWHFLAISFNPSSFRHKSEIGILLDDKYIKLPFPYPRFCSPIDVPLIGGSIPGTSFSLKRSVEVWATDLRGQMGAIYFLSCSLSEGQMLGVRALGPRYFFCFEPSTIVPHRDSQSSIGASSSPGSTGAATSRHQPVDPVASILDGSLSAHVFLSFNPAVWDAEAFLDNTPSLNDIKWPSVGCSSG